MSQVRKPFYDSSLILLNVNVNKKTNLVTVAYADLLILTFDFYPLNYAHYRYVIQHHCLKAIWLLCVLLSIYGAFCVLANLWCPVTISFKLKYTRKLFLLTIGDRAFAVAGPRVWNKQSTFCCPLLCHIQHLQKRPQISPFFGLSYSLWQLCTVPWLCTSPLQQFIPQTALYLSDLQLHYRAYD